MTSPWKETQVLGPIAVASADPRTNARAFRHSPGSNGITIRARCSSTFVVDVFSLPNTADGSPPADLTDPLLATHHRRYTVGEDGIDPRAEDEDIAEPYALMATLSGALGWMYFTLTPDEAATSSLDVNELGSA